MLYYFNENIVNTEAPAIVHGCNCQGKMASGVAKDIRANFPEAYEEYMKLVYSRKLGQPIFAHSKGKLIGNLLTQEFYGYDGEVYANRNAIRIALDTFCFYYRSVDLCRGIDNKMRPIASVKIGCGLGGLSWENDVKKIFEEISNYHEIDFYIYDSNKENFK